MTNKNKKIRIGLLYGGPSPEHDVSVVSAGQIKKYLDKDVYEVLSIKISRTGIWPAQHQLRKLKSKIDFAFIAMHGTYGEDGTIQALLESAGIPHTGSGVLASALAMDKWRSGLLAAQVGLRVPLSSILNQTTKVSNFTNKVVVKPNNGGSSIGVEILSKELLKKKVNSKNIKTSELIVQNYIPGRELTVSVIGNDHPIALPVIEIRSNTKFYDYKAKYSVGGSDHIIPAKISKSVAGEVQAAALLMHVVLGCKGATRSDFILDKNSKIWYLETNTIPGMTPTSLLPQAAAKIGIPFSELLNQLIYLAK